MLRAFRAHAFVQRSCPLTWGPSPLLLVQWTPAWVSKLIGHQIRATSQRHQTEWNMLNQLNQESFAIRSDPTQHMPPQEREREMRAIKITSILQDVTCTTNREHPRTLFICLSFPVYNYAILLMPLRLKEVAGQKWVRLGLEIRCRKCQRNSSRCMYQSHNGQRAFKQSFGDAKIWHMNMTLIWHMISLFWHTSFEYVWAETGWGWSPFRQSRWQRCCQDEQGLNSHIWVWHGMAWYGMVWHSGVGGSTLQYCACDACDILWRLWRRRSWKSCLMRPGHCSWHSSKTRLERWWLEKLAKEQ